VRAEELDELRRDRDLPDGPAGPRAGAALPGSHGGAGERPAGRGGASRASLPVVARLDPRPGPARRLPHTNRYTLTSDGIRIAVFYTKVYNRLLVPLTAANQAQTPPELQAALSAITRPVDDYTNRARLPRAA
jgi:hypothetical protein